MRYIISRPWFWTGLIAIIAYIDIRALSGGYVYDDAGSVIKNVVVNGMVDWKEVFNRDYWGTEMNQIQSHKSFRPITTLTLKANYVVAKYIQKYQQSDNSEEEEQQEQTKQDLPPTWTFRVINVLLHGIVTGLITKSTSYILPSSSLSSGSHSTGSPVMELIIGSLFALHPVHAEVVSNITSRGEMLMSIFFLLSFLSYAGTRQACYKQQQIYNRQSKLIQSLSTNSSSILVPWWKRLLGIYIFPWICMTLSIFSKEQGATALISLVIWDFLKYHGNLVSLQRKLFISSSNTNTKTNKSIISTKNDDDDDDDTKTTVAAAAHDDATATTAKIERDEARQFVWRTIVLAVETLIVVGWRYVLNGESSPDFIVAQNPAGFAEERFTRAFSVTWIYCLYIRDAIYPYYLSPDWSGNSIDLITNWNDPRVMAVLALWYFAAQSLWSMVVGADTGGNPEIITNNSSIGSKGNTKSSPKDNINWYWNETTLRQINMSIWAFSFSPFLLSSNILVVVGLMKADRVIYLPLFGFCILEALLISKLLQGATTMRPAFERRKEQLFWGAHFLLMFQLIIYSGRTHARNLAWSDSLQLWESAYLVNPRSYHTMYNYGYELSLKQRYVEAEAVMRPNRQCDKANVLLDEAFRVIEEKRKEGGPRNSESHLSRSESNLLVAKAHCTEDYQEKGRVLYRAVEKDQTNDYAVNLATSFMEKMQQMEELQRGD
ncbi:hypothetical protein FRACYDRAFT_247746 [Fragilariopsis cylindrus CCMP1102]|uniref:DUF1736 domain-containing protein n=1 Tax=Fragilariopsis cylindrus CCMP1102 TaxID=635003 RepID=A0A1E7EWG5_9STRA|nr:hypothetical protein FRACYDRAFT_247746 [Fragilariopsis cylindrus CCMP1102]|eukprot:OEU10135.1 hypothetical protein FRACYDRAFT_247746 [Fragilariopsis cylindrus CCMP1102]